MVWSFSFWASCWSLMLGLGSHNVFGSDGWASFDVVLTFWNDRVLNDRCYCSLVLVNILCVIRPLRCWFIARRCLDSAIQFFEEKAMPLRLNSLNCIGWVIHGCRSDPCESVELRGDSTQNMSFDALILWPQTDSTLNVAIIVDEPQMLIVIAYEIVICGDCLLLTDGVVEWVLGALFRLDVCCLNKELLTWLFDGKSCLDWCDNR